MTYKCINELKYSTEYSEMRNEIETLREVSLISATFPTKQFEPFTESIFPEKHKTPTLTYLSCK